MQRLSNGGGEFKIRRRSAIPPSFIRTCRRHTVVQHCIERHMNVRAQISRTLLSFVAIASILTCAGCGGGTSSGNPGAPTWNYTALGDSLASGLIAQEGYVTRYANYVNVDTGATVNTTNLGVPGWHSGDLLNALQNDAAYRASIQSAQVVTFDIGGNDVANAHDHYVQGICGGADNQDCLRNAVSTLEQNWTAIVTQLTTLRSTNDTILRTMDIYSPDVKSDMQASLTLPSRTLMRSTATFTAAQRALESRWPMSTWRSTAPMGGPIQARWACWRPTIFIQTTPVTS